MIFSAQLQVGWEVRNACISTVTSKSEVSSSLSHSLCRGWLQTPVPSFVPCLAEAFPNKDSKSQWDVCPDCELLIISGGWPEKQVGAYAEIFKFPLKGKWEGGFYKQKNWVCDSAIHDLGKTNCIAKYSS